MTPEHQTLAIGSATDKLVIGAIFMVSIFLPYLLAKAKGQLPEFRSLTIWICICVPNALVGYLIFIGGMDQAEFKILQMCITWAMNITLLYVGGGLLMGAIKEGFQLRIKDLVEISKQPKGETK